MIKLKVEHHSGDIEIIEVTEFNAKQVADEIKAQQGPVVIGENLYHWSSIKKVVVVGDKKENV